MVSEISKLIDAVIRQGLANSLRIDGFRKYGRTFVRQIADAAQIVNVQASQGNYDGRGQFTLNLGVYFPAVARRRGIVASGMYPKEYESTLRVRIGELMPTRSDLWWEIHNWAQISELAGVVANAYEQYGPSWFEKMLSLPNALEELEREGKVLMAASVALEIGNRERALALIEDDFSRTRPDARAYVRSFAERNGIPMETLLE